MSGVARVASLGAKRVWPVEGGSKKGLARMKGAKEGAEPEG